MKDVFGHQGTKDTKKGIKMKARPMKNEGKGDIPCDASEATHIWLNFPGPSGHIRLPVVHGNATRKGTPCWSWNGDTEKPTLKPSVLTNGHKFRCHSFVTDGNVQFLSDSSHEFKNKTVELLDVDI